MDDFSNEEAMSIQLDREHEHENGNILPEHHLWFSVLERFIEDLLRPGPSSDGKNYRKIAVNDWLESQDFFVNTIMPGAGLSDGLIERTIQFVNHLINVEIIDEKVFPDAMQIVNDKGEVLLFNRNFRRQRTPVR